MGVPQGAVGHRVPAGGRSVTHKAPRTPQDPRDGGGRSLDTPNVIDLALVAMLREAARTRAERRARLRVVGDERRAA